MTAPLDAPDTAPAVPPRPVRRRWKWVLFALLLVLLLPLGLLAWGLGTESGLRALAALATRLTDGQVVVEAPAGRLAGDVAIPRLTVTTPDMRLEVRGLRLVWQPGALWQRHVAIDTLAADSVDFAARPQPDETPTTPPAPPPAVRLPVSVALNSLQLGRFSMHAWEAAPGEAATDEEGREEKRGEGSEEESPPTFELRSLSAALASDGGLHRLSDLRVALPFGDATLAASLDSTASPFPLSAAGTLHGEQMGRTFDIRIGVAGDLLAPQITAHAEGEGVSGEAVVLAAPFEEVPLRQLQLRTSEIDPSLFHPDAPQGALAVTAELTPVPGEILALAGPVSLTNGAPASVDQRGIPVTALRADVQVSAQAARISGLALSLLGGGTVEGEADWQAPAEARTDDGPQGFGVVSARLRLADIQMQRLDGRLPPAIVSGRVTADGDAVRQTGDVDLKVGDAQIQLQGTFTPALAPAAENAAGSAPGAAADAAATDATPASFTAKGRLSRFNPRALLPDAPPANLNLDFDAKGVLAAEPAIDVDWTLAPSQFQGLPAQGRGRLSIQGMRLSTADIALDVAGNRVKTDGAWGHQEDVLNVDLDAPALSALGLGLAGRAALKGTLSGTLDAPAGQVTASAHALRLPGDVQLDALDLQGRLAAGLAGPLEVQLSVAALGKTGEPLWLERGRLSVNGRLAEHVAALDIATPQQDAVSLRLEGAFDQARTRWQGKLAELEAKGRFPVKLLAPAALTVSPELVSLAAARIDAGEHGRIALEETRWRPNEIVAKGHLSGLALALAESAPAAAATTASTSATPAAGAASPSGPAGAPRRRGPAPLQLGAEWDLRLAERAEGHMRIFREDGDLSIPAEVPMRLGLTRLEARLTARDDRIDVVLDAAGQEVGSLDGQVAVPIRRTRQGVWQLAEDGPLQGQLVLDVPSVAWVARMLQDNIELGGKLGARVSLAGTPAEPAVSGRIEGDALAVALLDQGVQLSGGALLATFDRDRLILDKLDFVSPNRVVPRDARLPVAALTREPGRLSASGAMALETGEGSFSFKVDRLPLLQRTDRWLVLSGEGKADTSWQRLGLGASFRVDAGFLELAETPPPSLSDDVVLVSDAPPAKRGGMQVAVEIGVSLGQHLYLSAMGLDTRLAGDLRIRMADGSPLTAVGSVSTIGGVFKGYGQNLTLERGLINFQGPLDNPGLNIVALRKGLAVEAGIEVAGSARRPLIKLVSDPDVPDPDKLSWIVLGRAPSAGSGADLGVLLPAAQALLGGGGGGMTEQLQQSLGLDEFGIGQGELGSVSRTATSRVVGSGSTVSDDAAVSGQVLMLGKRLSSDLFLSFEQSLGGAETLLKLTYQLTRRLSVVARGGTDTSADLYYTVSFR